MNEERDYFHSESGALYHVNRFEEMIKKKTRYYFDVDDFDEIIEHYIGAGKFNNAHRAVQFALRQHPDSTALLLKKAIILIEKTQPVESLQILKSLEKIEPDNPDVHIAKGMALVLTERLKEGVGHFNEAITKSGQEKAETMFNIGLFLEQKGHYKQAITYLSSAHDLDPENLSYIYDIAFCFERIEKLDNALDFYNRFLDLDPFSENVWYNIGVIYNRLDNYDKAIEAYDFAIALNGQYASAYFNKANSLANSGNHMEAIEVYKELLYLEEDNEEVLCYIGECFEKIDNMDKADEYYSLALDINPGYADAWLGRGMVMYSKGAYPESLKFVRKAIDCFPGNSEYWYSLGNIYMKIDRHNDSIKAYRRAIELDPHDFDSWLNLADVHLCMRKKDIAIEILEEADTVNPGNAMLNYRLAAYYFMRKNNEKAEYYLRIALSLDFELHKDFVSYYPQALKLKKVRRLIELFNHNK